MSNTGWDFKEEVKLTEYIAEQICSKASGRLDNECKYNYPRDVYFIGNFRPKENEEYQSSSSSMQELLNKMSPVAFGAEFRLKSSNNEISIDIELSWACYYRIFPTYEEQYAYYERRSHRETESLIGKQEDGRDLDQVQEPITTEDEAEASDDSPELTNETDAPEVILTAIDRRHAREPRDLLMIRFRKISCSAQGRVLMHQGASGEWIIDAHELQEALDKETNRARDTVIRDSDRIRTAGTPQEFIRVPDSALDSKKSYQSFVRSMGNDVIPDWKWEVQLRTRSYVGLAEKVVVFEFTNASPMPDNAPNTEAFVFDTKAKFQIVTGEVLPFELDIAPRGFRYDRKLWGRGFNCAVEPSTNSSNSKNHFITTHAPVFRQMRYVSLTQPSALFSELSDDPVPVLEVILDSMVNYKKVWQQARNSYVESYNNWEVESGAEFQNDAQQFEDEIDRFRQGLELIKQNDDIELAFKLTNETFHRGDPRKIGWRLFQIVFLVSQISGVAALSSNPPIHNDRRVVDIIYFPTGGGKTEAYLATIVFHCFFDRLRGKSAGVTAWTRFPLRLLTLQQTQRVADVIGIAELVRREQKDPRLFGEGVDGFAIGYFVGREATPNEISSPYSSDVPDPTWSQANDSRSRQRWKRVVRCPACRTNTITIDFNPDRGLLIHRCTNPNCLFTNGVIPVYVIDNEIYRYLPSVIVGTIDKLAGVGNQRKLSQIFGEVDGYCSIHGYYKGKCCQKDCRDSSRLHPMISSGLTGPTLFIQDELHLLKEGLGTFDSHYETFVQRLREEFGQSNPLKIIASSATIEAFARQIEHLYGRAQSEARVFPGLGPTARESFFAETLSYPQRLYIGIIPHNKTIFNTILELIEYYHREIQILQGIGSTEPNPYGGSLVPGTPEYHSLLDFYITSVTYFLANRELNSIRTDLEGDVNPNLRSDGLLELEINELTGSTSTDDVTLILENSEKPAGPGASPRTILATSMISHGVDIDRFNSMVLYGMPRQNAEYIQASSRIGRAHVGIVFSCLHPVRERDQSHYSYFCKFHEFLGQLIEPVAINRWSKFSVNRTLPGLFMGILLQLIANRSGDVNPDRYYMLDFVKKKISEGSITSDMFIPFLEEAYKVENASNVGEIAFRGEIRLRIQEFLDQIIGAIPGTTFVSEALIPKPMRSLRDVDESVEIELDDLGSQWAIRSHSRQNEGG